jgi:hypothetical protein
LLMKNKTITPEDIPLVIPLIKPGK